MYSRDMERNVHSSVLRENVRSTDAKQGIYSVRVKGDIQATRWPLFSE